ncbi:putative PIF1 DNA helicase/replication protein A1-like protein [Tanacetum coccineum]
MSETYSKLVKLVADPESGVTLRAKKIVLPWSYTRSLWYMIQNYLDVMTLCKSFGYPDLFITITCNPNWPEIARFMAEKGLKSDDRPNAITKVFKQKLDSLIKDFKEKGFPPVERLPFHLPNEQSVIFDETKSLDYMLDKASVNETKFHAWMERNKIATAA